MLARERGSKFEEWTVFFVKVTLYNDCLLCLSVTGSKYEFHPQLPILLVMKRGGQKLEEKDKIGKEIGFSCCKYHWMRNED